MVLSFARLSCALPSWEAPAAAANPSRPDVYKRQVFTRCTPDYAEQMRDFLPVLQAAGYNLFIACLLYTSARVSFGVRSTWKESSVLITRSAAMAAAVSKTDSSAI